MEVTWGKGGDFMWVGSQVRLKWVAGDIFYMFASICPPACVDGIFTCGFKRGKQEYIENPVEEDRRKKKWKEKSDTFGCSSYLWNIPLITLWRLELRPSFLELPSSSIWSWRNLTEAIIFLVTSVWASQDGHIFQNTRKNQIITCRQQNKTLTLLLYITITLRGNSFRQRSVHPGAYLLRWMVYLLYEQVGDGARWCTVVSLPRSACCWLCYSGSYSESYNASEAESDKHGVMYTCFQKWIVFIVF